MWEHPLGNSEESLLKLLNENAVERIIDDTWTTIWNKFLTFGAISAGIMAMYIIKITVDIILQGYAIQSFYGWSLHLLGTLWTSVTHFLVTQLEHQQTLTISKWEIHQPDKNHIRNAKHPNQQQYKQRVVHQAINSSSS